MIQRLSALAADGQIFLKIGAVSGAFAVALGAYGAHVFVKKPGSEAYDKVFQIANRYQFFHSIALLAMPLLKKPLIPGCLITAGMTLFCGTCYVVALTENRAYNKPAPVGGTLLIAGWLAILFC